MNTYYVVKTVVTDKKAHIFCDGEIKADAKPENHSEFNRRADIYTDYFNAKQEAEQFVEMQK